MRRLGAQQASAGGSIGPLAPAEEMFLENFTRALTCVHVHRSALALSNVARLYLLKFSDARSGRISSKPR